MSIQADDPRLTRYAVGEMDPSEREIFERELGQDPAAQAEVEALRKMADAVGAHFAAEEGPALARPVRRRGRAVLWFSGAAAAVFAAMVWFATRPPTVVVDADQVVAAERAVERAAREAPVDGDMADFDEAAREHRRREEVLGEIHGAREKPRSKRQVRVIPPNLREPSDPEPPPPADVPTGGPIAFASGREARVRAEADTESYDAVAESGFAVAAERHTSTFSIDVDTASYSNVRRFLRGGTMPPPGAVRLEEMVNYFDYEYAPPAADAAHPFAAHVEIATCPWTPAHRLARVALKGKTIAADERPASNLVFLIDVSGSMKPANKLPLVKRGLAALVERLDGRDRVAIVVYAGAAGLVLPSTRCDDKRAVLGALDRLDAGGSTNGGAGIQLAYTIARDRFVDGGVNRVVLATDGDFNVGTTDRDSLVRLIEENAKSGVFLTVLGFGTGNLKDATMEELSNRGNGNYAYVDTFAEAKKVLVDQLAGTLVTIAKDVKIQVLFNPARVAAWRLLGYENRRLRAEDFNDDTKDAGEIGAGHTVTVLYELVPAGGAVPEVARIDDNPFVAPDRPADAAAAAAWFRLRLRYKRPESDASTLLLRDARDEGAPFASASREFQWAASVAGFGMLLRESPHRGGLTWKGVKEIAAASRGPDPHGYRAEFLELVDTAAALRGPLPKVKPNKKPGDGPPRPPRRK